MTERRPSPVAEVSASDRDALKDCIGVASLGGINGIASRAADAILAAGFSRCRITSDPAEIEALPLGAVVLTANDVALRRHHPSPYGWCVTGDQAGFDTSEVVEFGPVTVLYDPEEER
jgi:hypothetical protein